MALFAGNINHLFVFEKHILRKILGPVQCKEEWRISCNKILQMWIKQKILNIQKVK
jgi:hypothetical protein